MASGSITIRVVHEGGRSFIESNDNLNGFTARETGFLDGSLLRSIRMRIQELSVNLETATTGDGEKYLSGVSLGEGTDFKSDDGRGGLRKL